MCKTVKGKEREREASGSSASGSNCCLIIESLHSDMNLTWHKVLELTPLNILFLFQNISEKKPFDNLASIIEHKMSIGHTNEGAGLNIRI